MMETTETLNSSFCRCCGSDKATKDLVSKYTWMEEDEVYMKMLKECFSLNLVIDKEQENGICDECIWCVRTACIFKKRVQKTEDLFRKRISYGASKEIKQESPDDNGYNLELEMCGDRDLERVAKIERSDVCDGGEAAGDDDESDVVLEFEVPLSRIKERKKIKKEKNPTQNPIPKGDLRKERLGACRKKKKKPLKAVATPERREHRVNLTTILRNSNASPFRDKTVNGYSCLYCSKPFPTIQELRAHTSTKEEKYKLNLLKDHTLSYHPIKVDITDLKCIRCDKDMPDLNTLKEHLVKDHNKKINKNIKDIIIPFRLQDGDGLTCVLCSVQHITFKNLYQHMSSHYMNFCCDECGVGYITIGALRKHRRTHEQGAFPCDYCEKVYKSLSKKKFHEKGVHHAGGWLRNKCPHCSEVFVSYYEKNEHLAQVHNEKPIIFPCNACHKVYKKKFELSRHIRNHHMQQKSYACTVCGARFFSARGMTDHMARHEGSSETHSCDVCGKSFTRARTLRDHLKTHECDTKYECEVCFKKFTQKSSLKTHMRLHQDDLDIFKEFDDVKHLVDNREVTLKQIALESKKKEAEEKAAKETEKEENCLQFFTLT